MLKGYFKGLIIRLTNPKRYAYLLKLRGDYSLLTEIKHKLFLKIKYYLDNEKITDYILISRIKTIGSVDRKDRYIKLLNKTGDHSDSIGFKIIVKNKIDCYKIMNILVTNFKLKKRLNLINPEDFFKHKKLMRNTKSIAKNHIFVKIMFDHYPIHFILMPITEYKYIHKQRQVYLNFIYKTINNKN